MDTWKPMKLRTRQLNGRLREELGVDAELGDVLGVYFFSDDPRGNGVLIVYRGSVSGSTFTLSAENSEASWFDPATIPPLAGGGHDRAVKDWLSRGEVSGDRTLGD